MEGVTKERTVKKIAWKHQDIKKERKTKKRWRKAVLEDLRDKGIADWRMKVMDRGGLETHNKALGLKGLFRSFIQ